MVVLHEVHHEEDGKHSVAIYSECQQYRYRLWRQWDESKPYCCFLMLNPSTATEVQNDPTVERCERYAKRWGYGGLQVINLFAYRATAPGDMKVQEDPVGKVNDAAILNAAKESAVIICAWGNHGQHLGRSDQVWGQLHELGIVTHCLKVNGTGEPAHPLYLRGDLKPTEYVR